MPIPKGIYLEHSVAVRYITKAGISRVEDVLGYCKARRLYGNRKGYIYVWSTQEILIHLNRLGRFKHPDIRPYLTPSQVSRHFRTPPLGDR